MKIGLKCNCNWLQCQQRRAN
uniref:Uncharacterized protein n=1 Tax=Tetranychus urticae TaxID=32264 RepID=T1JQ97_TETUR